MEMEMVEQVEAVGEATLSERLMEVALRLEDAVEQLAGRTKELSASASLEERLREAEATIATLRGAGRKTTGAGVATLQAKDGAAGEVGSLSGVLDSALVSLSLEQRIAVKSQLLRSGLLG